MEPTELNLEPMIETPDYYTWEVSGKPVSIRLDYDVVDRLLLDVMRGFGAVPRRGAEVGGILLGTLERDEKTIVRIRDFEPVLCQHARGPSYLLSEADHHRFEESVRNWQPAGGRPLRAVGCYRSHTRADLGLSEEDLALFARHFPDASDVFLLVKPFATRVSVGGFFFREEGQIRSDSAYLEFPFRRRELGGGSPAVERSESPFSPQAADDAVAGSLAALSLGAEPEPDVPSAEVPVVDPPKLKRNLWIPLSFVFLLVGVLLGFQTALMLHRQPSPALAEDPVALSLSVARSGDSLNVLWDRRAPAIQRARRGVLTITDRGYSKDVRLEPTQLQNGSVVYGNVSERVTFRLEVFVHERGSVSETVEFTTSN